MENDTEIGDFLSKYSEDVFSNALKLREIIFKNLAEVQEHIGMPAKMIAYTYGQKYIEMVCTPMPSKKGLNLVFIKALT